MKPIPDDNSDEKMSLLDTFGKVVDNVGSSAKVLVIIAASSIVLFTPSSWLPIYYCSMSMLCSTISKSIKNTLRWPRPIGSPEEGYGMPSSHAQAFFFWFSTISLKLLVFPEFINPISYVICPLVGTYSVMASYWRIKIRLHSFPQTLAGALLGSSFAYIAVSKQEQLLEQLAQIMSNALHPSPSDPIVPLWLRMSLVGVGSALLHYPEIGESLKKRWTSSKPPHNKDS